MFVHAVYFWLRKNLTPAEERRFLAGLESLRAIEGVSEGYIGVPAPTDRPVIERVSSSEPAGTLNYQLATRGTNKENSR